MESNFAKWKLAAGVLVVLALMATFGSQYFESSEYVRISSTIERKPVPVDLPLLEEYAGTYQLRPGFEVEVTVVEGALFAQATGQARVQFHAASEVVFFNEITPLLMKFERNGKGSVQQFRALEPGRSRLAVRIEG